MVLVHGVSGFVCSDHVVNKYVCTVTGYDQFYVNCDRLLLDHIQSQLRFNWSQTVTLDTILVTFSHIEYKFGHN